jgi:xanthine dehydrogenase YagR molybdenum-binding subunit
LALPAGTNESVVDALRRRGQNEIVGEAENIPEGLKADSIDKLRKGQLPMLDGMSHDDVTAYAFGAQFVEVRVHSRTHEIRVPRMVGAFAAGTIVNPLAAHSQYMGGMIWGVGAALLEKTEIDPRFARYINDNISEYHIPVNADVCKVDVIMVPEEDQEVNPFGVKGIGEIGIVGVNAAIANAVFHATGRRVRKLPIRMEDLL